MTRPRIISKQHCQSGTFDLDYYLPSPSGWILNRSSCATFGQHCPLAGVVRIRESTPCAPAKTVGCSSPRPTVTARRTNWSASDTRT
ncbi:hypothetical protein AVEN_38302-1 [Araneus ventricosus]|uniref:Uncharacterized protein n=1 Tax=Araneus ventricosus TaxID=182803 RepID=A0A4Y2W342_ARAVE|nr:hypothetical protein AVEN_38302-1 [Araneus ventricosus]